MNDWEHKLTLLMSKLVKDTLNVSLQNQYGFETRIYSQDFGFSCVVGLQIMPFFCVSGSQSDAQLCSSLRASATPQGVVCLVSDRDLRLANSYKIEVTSILQQSFNVEMKSCSGCCETVSEGTRMSHCTAANTHNWGKFYNGGSWRSGMGRFFSHR